MNDLITRKHPKTKFFLDWEFFEDGEIIIPASIGLVCEDGREFYRENGDADWSKANPWVRENVLPHLHGTNAEREYNAILHSAKGQVPDRSHPDVVPKGRLAIDLRDFVNEGQHLPEFWGYFSSYDWIVTCQLFGAMGDLPRSWPQFCLDLMQECYLRGIYDPKSLLPVEGTEHNALDDARWNFQLFKLLSGLE